MQNADSKTFITFAYFLKFGWIVHYFFKDVFLIDGPTMLPFIIQFFWGMLGLFPLTAMIFVAISISKAKKAIVVRGICVALVVFFILDIISGPVYYFATESGKVLLSHLSIFFPLKSWLFLIMKFAEYSWIINALQLLCLIPVVIAYGCLFSEIRYRLEYLAESTKENNLFNFDEDSPDLFEAADEEIDDNEEEEDSVFSSWLKRVITNSFYIGLINVFVVMLQTSFYTQLVGQWDDSNDLVITNLCILASKIILAILPATLAVTGVVVGFDKTIKHDSKFYNRIGILFNILAIIVSIIEFIFWW